MVDLGVSQTRTFRSTSEAMVSSNAASRRLNLNGSVFDGNFEQLDGFPTFLGVFLPFFVGGDFFNSNEASRNDLTS